MTKTALSSIIEIKYEAIRALLVLMVMAMTLLSVKTAAQAGSPSFNCNARLTSNERLICIRDDLSSLDREVSDAYHELTSILNRAAANLVRADQRRWLKQRQKCKRNVACTKNLFLLRLDELADSLNEQKSYRTPPKDEQVNCALSGQYLFQGRCVNDCPPDFVAEPRGHRCRAMSGEERDGGLCGPGFTNVRGKCIHNSDLSKKNNNKFSNRGPIQNGIYGIYILAHGDSLRLDHTADKLLYTQNKAGNPNDPKQPFRFTFHNGSYIITDIKSGLRLHADGNGDWKVSTRYQPKDGFTKFNIVNANEGCFFIRTEASGNYWIWEPNSQVIQVRPQNTGEESMFCLVKQ